MASIPKKITERFARNVLKFQKVLQATKNRDVNESDTVAVLGDILGEVFGYDKYLEVTSEFAIRGTYCDLAIKIDDKVQFLIEVKAIGIDLKEAHVKQAIDYGANHGVQWVVLTNGIEWRVYRIKFEQPIGFELIYSFNFLNLKPKSEKDQKCLFILSKEGLDRNARDNFYEKVQSVNRYIIGNLIISEPVIASVRRELKKLDDGLKIDATEIREIVRTEILKREILEGEEAGVAAARITRFYKKSKATHPPKNKATPGKDSPQQHSVSPKLA